MGLGKRGRRRWRLCCALHADLGMQVGRSKQHSGRSKCIEYWQWCASWPTGRADTLVQEQGETHQNLACPRFANLCDANFRALLAWTESEGSCTFVRDHLQRNSLLSLGCATTAPRKGSITACQAHKTERRNELRTCKSSPGRKCRSWARSHLSPFKSTSWHRPIQRMHRTSPLT